LRTVASLRHKAGLILTREQRVAWLTKLLLTLLAAFVASQIAVGLVAWKDGAVATSWIKDLSGKQECLYDFSPEEALRLDRLATVISSQLGVEDRLRVDCYLRKANNWRELERRRRDLVKARAAITQAATLGGVAVIIFGLLCLFGWLGRRKHDERRASSQAAEV